MKIFDKLRFGFRIPQILKELNETNKLLNELNWANVFNSTISASEWYNNKSISPGRWAAGYPLLYVLYRILNEVKPQNILEFGLGQSTKMLHQYGFWNKNSQITTIEHSDEWIQLFNRNNKFPGNCKISLHENEEIIFNGKKTTSVKNLGKVIENQKFDLIINDAPYGSPNFSRSQVIKLIKQNLSKENFCIIIDDYNRKGEKETCKELEKELNTHKIVFKKGKYSGEKEFAIYCSPNLWFLLSL